jgi:hypothetical protein
MKIQSLYNAILGIATEIFYAIAIILAAFLICVAVFFLKP